MLGMRVLSAEEESTVDKEVLGTSSLAEGCRESGIKPWHASGGVGGTLCRFADRGLNEPKGLFFPVSIPLSALSNPWNLYRT